MDELTGLKSYSATNYIQDKDGNIIKHAYSATNKFIEHFCSFHKVFKGYLKTQQRHPQKSILSG